MEPKQSSGSFMAPAGGGGSALQKLMSMGGIGAGSPLNQNTTSPNAAMPSGALPSPQGSMQGGTQGSTNLPAPVSSAPPMPPVSMPPTAMNAGTPPMGASSIEKEIILKALSGRLKDISKLEEAQVLGGA